MFTRRFSSHLMPVTSFASSFEKNVILTVRNATLPCETVCCGRACHCRKAFIGRNGILHAARSSQNPFQIDVQTVSRDPRSWEACSNWEIASRFPTLRLAWKCLSYFEFIPELPSGANVISGAGPQQDGSVLLAVATPADSQYSV